MRMFRAMTNTPGGRGGFLREWFEGGLDPDIMIGARSSAEIVVRLLLAKLRQQSAQARPTLDLCVSHDMTLHLLKDQVLGLRHEEYGEVEFLNGVVLFERDGDVWMQGHQAAPISLTRFLGS
jgi:broad specificity phosphatase PhoE